ncbi:MAG TPA: matrixin family metalloprotease, partial [Gammaproteobacteria bacterium]|nr:matrixin family metalloprotease [Gammaproteobacteria bacterium]
MMLRTLLLLLTYLATMTSGYAFVGDESEETEKRFLGISSDFGRWESGLIRWGYNPTNAPAAYSDASNTVAIIQRAMDEWSNVSGLQFEFQETSSSDTSDNVVMITWDNDLSSLTLGQAGPSWSTSNSDYQQRGYPYYADGSFKLNDNITDWDDEKLEATALHELGHLVGLGHSDNPDSVMYANPYNHLRHLRDDDIAAVQVLYG